MSKKQTIHTETFRREAIRLLENSGKSVSELAGELGVHEKSLYRWRRQYGTSSPAPATAEPDERDAEIKRLRRELEIVRQERDILKKAISIFSRSQP
jgi:transposase